MVVGVLRVELSIQGARSLKEKRSVVRRVVARVKNVFEISVAEVDFMDYPASAALGMAVVSNDGRLANSVLDKVVNFIEDLHLAQITHAEIEILHV